MEEILILSFTIAINVVKNYLFDKWTFLYSWSIFTLCLEKLTFGRKDHEKNSDWGSICNDMFYSF